ncbi:unnamed protein product [Fusarium graminearum]|nr:unnamed protein product [Fusarium graminearum]CAG1988890.1 unnamed protein product [Fusarium graminearum]VTO83866.1 unnamed protein product [Fusarium graminearum]
MKLLCSSCSRTGQYPTANIKRQFSDNPSKNNDIKIGLIVGFTLAAFLAIVITFLYFYYGSARFTFRKKKKNHRHQHHHHLHHHPLKHMALYPACSLSDQRNSASPILHVSEAHPSRSVYGSAVDVDSEDGMQAQAVEESSHQQNPVCDRVSDVDSLGGVEKHDFDRLVRIRNFLGSLQNQRRDEQLLDVVCESGDDDEDECESVSSYIASGPFETLLV